MNTELLTLHLCVLSCLFFSALSKPGKVLPPRNVSALWDSDFNPGLSWYPPLHSGTNCSYNVSATTKTFFTNEVDMSPANFPLLTMEGGSIHWKITTVCEGLESEPAVLNVNFPELVKDLECFLYSTRKARCQWSPGRQTPDFRFYYKLGNECRKDTSVLQECSPYNVTDGVKSGCELQATRCHTVYVLVNGTLSSGPVRNTFTRILNKDVRPPQLEWTVTKSGNKFNITWKPPEIPVPDGWAIQINYTECGVTHQPLDIKGETFHLLNLDSRCRNGIAVAATSPNGKTPWGDWKHFDKDADLLLYVVVVVPVLIAVLVALFCVCFQKNKATIFPKVPEPVDYLSEFSNNNNNTKNNFHNLYSPVKEEECIFSLVIDPELSRENC